MSDTGAKTGPYEGLADGDREFLKRAANELRAKLRRTVSEVVASGRLLAQARRRLGREQWAAWLESEAQIPPRSASRLVNVGTAFASTNDDTLLNFTPTALYTLCEPGVPQSLREYAIEQAAEGEEVTAGTVREWLTAYRQQVPEGETNLLKLARPVAEDAPPKDPFVDPDEVYASENWSLLRELLGSDGTVHLSASADTEAPDMVLVCGNFIGAAGERRTHTGPTLESVILHLSRHIRTKECRACGSIKPLEDFCRRSDMPDGREYRCKACERRRVKAHTEKRRGTRRAEAG